MTSLLPTLPAYIADLGGTTQQVGLVMGCFAIGLLLSRTWLGWLADNRSRKLVVLIGTVVVALAPLGYVLADSIPVMASLRAFHGISIAAFTTGYSTLVIDLSPAKQRGEIIGYMSLAVPVGMAIGPALGGYLQASVGYIPLFLVSASCGLVAFILATRVRETKAPVTLSQIGVTERKSRRSFGELLQNHSLLVPALILFLIGLLFGTLVAFLPLFIRAANIDFNAGLFYSAAAIASFSVRVFAGRASDRVGRGLFITASLLCYGISMVLLALANNPNSLIIAAAFEGAAAGVLIPMMLALMSDRSYPGERGRVSALCIGGFDLGIAIAGPILGYLAVFLSYRGIFYLASSFAISAVLIFLTQSSKSLPHSLRFALGRENDAYALGDG